MHRVGVSRRRGRRPGRGGSHSAASCSSKGSAPTSRWPTNPTTPTPIEQLARFDARPGDARTPAVRARRSCTPPTRPRCSRSPRRAYDLVRVGIAIYGVAPGTRLRSTRQARPALSLKRAASRTSSGSVPARVSRTDCATSSTRDARIATVPIGYADGVPRNLASVGGEVAGARSPVSDCRHGHDGPADGRRRRRPGRGR